MSTLALVGELLPDWRIGVVAMGRLPGGYISSIEQAIEPAGADVESVSVIASPLPLGRIAGELEDTNLRRVDRDNDDLERLGRRIGRGLVQGGELVEPAATGALLDARAASTAASTRSSSCATATA